MDEPLRLVSSRAPEAAEAARSFEAFFEAESRTLFRRLWLVTGNRAEAEEIMQDAFLKMWEEDVGAPGPRPPNRRPDRLPVQDRDERLAGPVPPPHDGGQEDDRAGRARGPVRRRRSPR
jgi:hypothetical protein